MSVLRARWAAIGAAVAVTFGAGGLAAVSATAPTGASTFVPISPCRLFDTRPEAKYNKGPRKTPLKAGETWVVQVTGDNGNCKGIPAAATAVTLNLTSDYTSQLTFLTVWPEGEPRPDASALNPVKDHPAPNEINTRLGPSGKIQIYSDQGSTDVIADITGYYIDHNHDDRYPTKAQLDARSPQNSVISIGSADFNALGVGDVAASATGTGAYPAAGTTSNALVAGVNVPNGATVTGVTVEYIDGSAGENLSVSLRCESMGKATELFKSDLPDAKEWASAPLTLLAPFPPTTTTVPTTAAPTTTTAPTTTVASSTTVASTTTIATTTTTAPTTTTTAPTPGQVVANQTCAYQVYATAPNWSAATTPGSIQIGAVHVAVKMPS